jgi:hypothetical protein
MNEQTHYYAMSDADAYAMVCAARTRGALVGALAGALLVLLLAAASWEHMAARPQARFENWLRVIGENVCKKNDGLAADGVQLMSNPNVYRFTCTDGLGLTDTVVGLE